MRATRRGLPLVEREVQILGLIAHGGSYAEIAAQLHLAHASVKNYAASAIKKLGARSQAHAVHLAYQAGIFRRERHGDHPGYNAHKRRGETPCDACVQGELDYRATRRSSRHHQPQA
ncbi:response regulator transcription factor [Streptomyces griseoluteus]